MPAHLSNGQANPFANVRFSPVRGEEVGSGGGGAPQQTDFQSILKKIDFSRLSEEEAGILVGFVKSGGLSRAAVKEYLTSERIAETNRHGARFFKTLIENGKGKFVRDVLCGDDVKFKSPTSNADDQILTVLSRNPDNNQIGHGLAFVKEVFSLMRGEKAPKERGLSASQKARIPSISQSNALNILENAVKISGPKIYDRNEKRFKENDRLVRTELTGKILRAVRRGANAERLLEALEAMANHHGELGLLRLRLEAAETNDPYEANKRYRTECVSWKALPDDVREALGEREATVTAANSSAADLIIGQGSFGAELVHSGVVYLAILDPKYSTTNESRYIIGRRPSVIKPLLSFPPDGHLSKEQNKEQRGYRKKVSRADEGPCPIDELIDAASVIGINLMKYRNITLSELKEDADFNKLKATSYRNAYNLQFWVELQEAIRETRGEAFRAIEDNPLLRKVLLEDNRHMGQERGSILNVLRKRIESGKNPVPEWVEVCVQKLDDPHLDLSDKQVNELWKGIISFHLRETQVSTDLLLSGIKEDIDHYQWCQKNEAHLPPDHPFHSFQYDVDYDAFQHNWQSTLETKTITLSEASACRDASGIEAWRDAMNRYNTDRLRAGIDSAVNRLRHIMQDIEVPKGGGEPTFRWKEGFHGDSIPVAYLRNTELGIPIEGNDTSKTSPVINSNEWRLIFQYLDAEFFDTSTDKNQMYRAYPIDKWEEIIRGVTIAGRKAEYFDLEFEKTGPDTDYNPLVVGNAFKDWKPFLIKGGGTQRDRLRLAEDIQFGNLHFDTHVEELRELVMRASSIEQTRSTDQNAIDYYELGDIKTAMFDWNNIKYEVRAAARVGLYRDPILTEKDEHSDDITIVSERVTETLASIHPIFITLEPIDDEISENIEFAAACDAKGAISYPDTSMNLVKTASRQQSRFTRDAANPPWWWGRGFVSPQQRAEVSRISGWKDSFQEIDDEVRKQVQRVAAQRENPALRMQWSVNETIKRIQSATEENIPLTPERWQLIQNLDQAIETLSTDDPRFSELLRDLSDLILYSVTPGENDKYSLITHSPLDDPEAHTMYEDIRVINDKVGTAVVQRDKLEELQDELNNLNELYAKGSDLITGEGVDLAWLVSLDRLLDIRTGGTGLTSCRVLQQNARVKRDMIEEIRDNTLEESRKPSKGMRITNSNLFHWDMDQDTGTLVPFVKFSPKPEKPAKPLTFYSAGWLRDVANPDKPNQNLNSYKIPILLVAAAIKEIEDPGERQSKTEKFHRDLRLITRFPD